MKRLEDIQNIMNTIPDKTKELFKELLLELIEQNTRPNGKDYWNGKEDAYQNIYKLLDGRSNECDEFTKWSKTEL